MNQDYSRFSRTIRRLVAALDRLDARCREAELPVCIAGAGVELLREKLLPQVDAPPVLIVSIVGGTNIGKSSIFNHIAGERVSAVSPLAAGTKHPVCLVPESLSDTLLRQWFSAFEIETLSDAEAPLHESPQHRLYRRRSTVLPERLVLVDAPDVDSDMPVNWERAAAIRNASDVLIAVLTQQKYNDAAVKRFFREAASADKPVIVVFNQVDPEEDADFWPRWLETFTRETNLQPEWVYLVPRDRRANEELRLPFYKAEPGSTTVCDAPVDPRKDLSELAFDRLKLRAMRGAVRRLFEGEDNLPQVLGAIEACAQRFRDAARVLDEHLRKPTTEWPVVPSSVLVHEIRDWWDARRPEWSRMIFAGYRRLGGFLWSLFAKESADPQDVDSAFHARERAKIEEILAGLFAQIDILAQGGNEILAPRLKRIASGPARDELAARVARAHDALPLISEGYRTFLRAELDRLQAQYPRIIRWLRVVDNAMAVARPSLTVALLVSSWGLAGGLIGQAGHAAGEVFGEAVLTGGMTAAGEGALAVGSEGLQRAAASLVQRLHQRFVVERAQWLADQIDKELLGELLAELRAAAEIPQSAPFDETRAALDDLAHRFALSVAEA
ncbi:hypothetical protein JCM19992_02880 [Thermostilla marina]